MIGILLAGGVGSSAGRWMTSKKLKSALEVGDSVETKATSTETVVTKKKR